MKTAEQITAWPNDAQSVDRPASSDQLPAVVSPSSPAVFGAEQTAPIQRGRPFVPGQSGNPAGRPKGARNKLTEAFLSALANDFAAHGPAAIERLRSRDPSRYLKLVASIMPRDLILKHESTIDYAELSDEEVCELLNAKRRRDAIEAALNVKG